MEVFLLEDDAAIGMGLSYALENEGYKTTLTRTVSEALKLVEEKAFSLYILDLTLPDGSGYDVCKAIRQKTDAPVLFLTAYDDEVNVVMGLELGADDYISKPFRIKELLARMKSVLRRCKIDNPDGCVRIKNLEIRTGEAKVFKDGKEIILTAMEYRLLLILLNNRGHILSRTALLENIWDVAGDFVNDNTLTVYIKRLPDLTRTVKELAKEVESLKEQLKNK